MTAELPAPVGDSADAGWHVHTVDGDHGPHTAEELKALVANGDMKPADLVRRGRQQWTRADRFAFLFPPTSSDDHRMPTAGWAAVALSVALAVLAMV